MGYTHVRCTFRLSSFQGDTTTESFYRASSTLGTVNPDAGPVVHCRNWINKRVLCMAKSWRIRSFRVSPAVIPGGGESAARLSLNIPVDAVGVGQLDLPQDVPATVRLIPLRTATGHTRQYGLHAVTDTNIFFDPNGIPGGGVSPTQAAYLDYLVGGNGWMMEIFKVGATDPNNKVVNAISVTDGVVSFTVPGLGALPGGRKVVVSGAKGYKVSPFNNEWIVDDYNVGTGILTATTKRIVDSQFFYVRNSARLRIFNDALIGFEEINSYGGAESKPATHKVGNPTEGRAGRRSSKR